jgi:hypothetical protein
MREKESKSRPRAVWAAAGTGDSCAGTRRHDQGDWRGVGEPGDLGSCDRDWRRLA